MKPTFFTSRSLAFAAALMAAAPALSQADLPALPEGMDAGDWQSICDAHDAARYTVEARGASAEAANPEQGFTSKFDSRGVSVVPDGLDWRFGLELESYGFGADRIETGSAKLSVDGNRLSYQWSDSVSEWFINEGSGIEHGYTLNERPGRTGDSDEPLIFDLDVRGGLKPVVDANGKDVSFVNDEGAVVVRYTGLKVYDSQGADISAKMESVDGDVHIVVDDAEAVYPLTIDPVIQTAFLKASNAAPNDAFGVSVAISGTQAVVGAPLEDGVGDAAPESGAAYVFQLGAGGWTQVAILRASNADAGDLFGTSVDIAGDRIIVGAPEEDSATDPTVNLGFSANTGAAYIYSGGGTAWTQEAILKGLLISASAQFGSAVAIGSGPMTGDRVIVGAPFMATESGRAYLYERAGTTWTGVGSITAPNISFGDRLGTSVDIDGDTAVAGAPGEDGSGTSVPGSFNDLSPDAGAAYFSERGPLFWGPTNYLKAAIVDAGDSFGTSVSVDATIMAIGAIGEDSSSTGPGGNPFSNASSNSGAVYIFRRGFTTWAQETMLKASNTGAFDLFGADVEVSGTRVIAGAPFEDGASTGVNGDEASNSASRAGAAYVFDSVGTTWTQQTYVKASNTEANDEFGTSVGLSGSFAIVGAPNEDSFAAAGQANNGALSSGAGYLYDLDAGSGNYCVATNNSTGMPGVMSWTGSNTAANNNFTLVASSLPLNQFGIFIVSPLQGFVPAAVNGSNGNLCLASPIGRYNIPLNSGFTGTYQLQINLNTIPQGSGTVMTMPGMTWNFQSWHRDVVGAGSNYTDAISVTFL